MGSRSAELIAELLAAGDAVDVGAFTLDHASAVAKLAEFRYADRDEFLVIAAEACSVLGATALHFDTDGADIRLHAPGVDLGDASSTLPALFSHALGSAGQDYGPGRLAVAIHMAIGRPGCRAIAVTGVDTESTTLSVFAGVEAPSVSIASGEASESLRIIWDFGLIAEADALFGEPHRVALDRLEAAVAYTTLDVTLNGRRISGTVAPEAFEEADGLRVARVAAAPGGLGSLFITSGQIVIDRRALGSESRYAIVAELVRPRRDVSGVRVVDDGRLAAATGLGRSLLNAAPPALGPRTPRPRLLTWSPAVTIFGIASLALAALGGRAIPTPQPERSLEVRASSNEFVHDGKLYELVFASANSNRRRVPFEPDLQDEVMLRVDAEDPRDAVVVLPWWQRSRWAQHLLLAVGFGIAAVEGWLARRSTDRRDVRTQRRARAMVISVCTVTLLLVIALGYATREYPNPPLSLVSAARVTPVEELLRFEPRFVHTRGEARFVGQALERHERTHHPIRDCYRDELRRTPTLAGALRLGLFVDESGRIKRLSLMGDELTEWQLESCIERAVRRVQFGPSRARSVSVRIELGLRGTDAEVSGADPDPMNVWPE